MSRSHRRTLNTGNEVAQLQRRGGGCSWSEARRISIDLWYRAMGIIRLVHRNGGRIMKGKL